MANSINNLVTAAKNIINAATTTVSVSSQVLADSTALLTNSVKATPDVIKAIAESPFAATKGYIMESEDDVSEEQAEARAYKYIRQDAAKTVTQVATAGGSLFADLLQDDGNNNTMESMRVKSSGE